MAAAAACSEAAWYLQWWQYEVRLLRNSFRICGWTLIIQPDCEAEWPYFPFCPCIINDRVWGLCKGKMENKATRPLRPHCRYSLWSRMCLWIVWISSSQKWITWEWWGSCSSGSIQAHIGVGCGVWEMGGWSPPVVLLFGGASLDNIGLCFWSLDLTLHEGKRKIRWKHC